MENAEEKVRKLPRRTAHALHALIETQRESNMPPTASEIVLYDEEAISIIATGAALRHAKKLGLAIYTGTYWTPTFEALELRSALEDRYLRETARNLKEES